MVKDEENMIETKDDHQKKRKGGRQEGDQGIRVPGRDEPMK